MQRTGLPRGSSRRNSARVRRKPATTVPDILFTLAVMGWGMAAVFVVASFVDQEVTAGEAGVALARLFAAALSACALFVFLIGLMLLRDDRGRADHYVTPFVLGVVMGALEATIFLRAADKLLVAPFVLIVFAFRPVRRFVARQVRPSRGYAR